MGWIARYIGRDLERAQVLALLAGRVLTAGSPYGPSRSRPDRAAALDADPNVPAETASGAIRRSETSSAPPSTRHAA
jgi:hypothetical protein